MTVRRGVTLVEALVALAAGAVACAGMASLMIGEERLARARADRIGRAEALRIAGTVLVREFSVADPASDLAGIQADSASARLFRGLAVTCAPGGPGEAIVRWSGEREPDPAKDSVLPLDPPDAHPLALGASSHAAVACPGSGELLKWQLATTVPTGTALLLFQHGVYALSGSALRVRHGGEGRQPLTGGWFDDRRSAFLLRSDSSSHSAWLEVRTAFAGGAVERRFRVALVNTGTPGRAP